ncbi:MAG: L,D-transpeptidase family protein [Pseudomonadota bacterium]
MRKLLCIALASTFLVGAPVVAPVLVQPVEAQTLFDRLFPRTAQRRRERLYRQQLQREREIRAYNREIRRQRQAAQRKRAPKIARVQSSKFKKYAPRKLSPVRLTSLTKAFAAHDRKLVEAEQARLQAVPQRQGSLPQNGFAVGNAVAGGAALTGAVVLASQAQESLAAERPIDELQTGVIGPPMAPQVPAPQTVEPVEPEPQLADIRLSAGGDLLKGLKLRAGPALGKAMVNFYKANPEFLWLDGEGKPNEKAAAVMRVLAGADEYGLRLEDYSMPLMDGVDENDRAARLRAALQFEFSTTMAALRYMQDARHGVVDPNRISGYHDFKGLQLDFANSLQTLAESELPAEAMLAAHPQDKAFEAMRKELANLRQAAQGYESITIKRGTFIRPGQTNDQVANIVESIRRMGNGELMAKHADVFAQDHSAGQYTTQVAEMVRDFQKSVNLKPDAIVGKNTIARMKSDDPNVKLNKVLFAMERLRWHPDRLGSRHVFINQPAYKASYINGGEVQLSMRTVVGKKSNQTNFFYDEIDYVEFNPYWGIPRSILVNEMLPKLRRNPSYFDNLGYEMTDVRGNPVWSSEVNWYQVGADFPYNVRQPPGAKNALGELKIMFPNKHSIYMHDTPAKSLFKRTKRAYSHGCVRLAEPRKMAAAVLGTSMEKIEDRLFGGVNNRMNLKTKVPVYVSYFTAWPTEAGTMNYYADMYERDKALGKAMEMEGQARAKAKQV